MQEWVRIDREIIFGDICKDGDYLSVWVWLLLNADNGEMITTIDGLSRRLGIQGSKLRRILKCYRDMSKIEISASTQNTIIRLLDFGFYCGENGIEKGERQTSDERMTNERQTNDERTKAATPQRARVRGVSKKSSDERMTNERQTNDERLTNENKKKENKIYFDNAELNQIFLDYLDVRKKLKTPNTDRAVNGLLNELKKHCTADDGNFDTELASYVVNQSIIHGWKSFYEPKDDNRKIIKPKKKTVKEAENEKVLNLWDD